MTHGLDLVAALKSAGVALIDGGTLIAGGGKDSVSADIVQVLKDTKGAGKGGEDEDQGGEGANEHLGLSF